MRQQVESRNAGFTLVELMVAMVVSIIVAGAMYAVYQSQTRTQITQEVTTENNENRRAVLMIMENEIRMAGADMTQSAGAGIERVEDDEFWFTRDITGPDGWPDGNINPADGENIRYKLHNGALGRDTEGEDVGDEDDDDLVPLLTNVDGLVFEYFVYDPTTGNFEVYDDSVDDENDIGRVDITVNARSSQAGRGFLNQEVSELEFTTSIMLRNLPRP